MRLEELKGVTLSDAANDYIENVISPGSRYSYKCNFNDFFKRKLLDPEQSLYSFSLSDVNAIGENIRKKSAGKYSTRQNKASFYRGFTLYLNKITLGRIRKSKVFYKNTWLDINTKKILGSDLMNRRNSQGIKKHIILLENDLHQILHLIYAEEALQIRNLFIELDVMGDNFGYEIASNLGGIMRFRKEYRGKETRLCFEKTLVGIVKKAEEILRFLHEHSR